MILVTGSNGQVGSEIQYLSTQMTNYQFVFANSKDLDITDETAINTIFDQYQFQYCINCAAFTAVDKAESDVENAQKVNAAAVEYLAKACKKHNTQLIHLSTDYVYHSEHINRPYRENDATNPKCIYGKTKLEGDLIATAILSDAIVIRTSWVYSSFGNNFVKSMIRLGNKLNHLRIVYDQIGTPTYARDLAKAMLTIVSKIEDKTIENHGGIYHYSNEGVTTWYDFALAIFELKNIEVTTAPIESKDYPTPAKRPHFSVLNKEKIRTTFDLSIPHWRTALVECLEVLN